MKNSLLYTTTVCTLATLLTACSSDYGTLQQRIYGRHGLIHPKPASYARANEIKALTLPPGLSDQSLEPLYEIPPATNTTDQAVDNLTPPGSVLAKLEQDRETAFTAAATTSKKAVAHSGAINSEPNKAGVITNTLIIARPLADAWTYLVQILPAAGFKVVSRDPKLHTIQVLQLSSGDGSRLLEVNFASHDNNSAEVWFRAPFGKVLSMTENKILLQKLQQKIEKPVK